MLNHFAIDYNFFCSPHFFCVQKKEKQKRIKLKQPFRAIPQKILCSCFRLVEACFPRAKALCHEAIVDHNLLGRPQSTREDLHFIEEMSGNAKNEAGSLHQRLTTTAGGAHVTKMSQRLEELWRTQVSLLG